MSIKRRLAQIEQTTPPRDFEALRQALAAMPYRELTRAELLKLKRDLAIPEGTFRRLFGEVTR